MYEPKITVLSSRKHDMFIPELESGFLFYPGSGSRIQGGSKRHWIPIPRRNTAQLFDFQPLSRIPNLGFGFIFCPRSGSGIQGSKRTPDRYPQHCSALMFDLLILVGFSACGNTSISFKFTTKQTEGLLLYQVGFYRK